MAMTGVMFGRQSAAKMPPIRVAQPVNPSGPDVGLTGYVNSILTEASNEDSLMKPVLAQFRAVSQGTAPQAEKVQSYLDILEKSSEQVAHWLAENPLPWDTRSREARTPWVKDAQETFKLGLETWLAYEKGDWGTAITTGLKLLPSLWKTSLVAQYIQGWFKKPESSDAAKAESVPVALTPLMA